ncbi:MAG: insulinase family protein [candidate division WOR-3 bacterium]|nr:insulinase family protein [candidate division WOR-3 bacterium]MCX7947086.1 insulinase family protein [candidate division WOR-3 bacterium]MDW8149873.1 pitrilysin family protein [candidate division WOR-3 bacterium]
MEIYKINGLEVILDNRENSRLSHIILASRVGSRYEQKSGITHFLEHTIFRGSKHYSYEEINEFFELYGGSIDAWTTKENLVIFTSILNEKLKEALKIIFDIIANSTFENYEKEKSVIIQEYREILDNYEERSYYYLNKAIFKEHPLSREIIGTKENILNFTMDDLLRRKNEVFSKDNVVMLISGSVNIDDIIRFIEDNFYLENYYKLAFLPFNSYYPSNIIKKRKAYNNYVSLGIPIFNYHEFKLALNAFSYFLGSGSSSILFDIIRGKYGLVYDIHTFLDLYREVSVFGISYVVSKSVNERVVEEIIKILRSLESHVNFKKLKQKFKTSIIIEFDSYLNYLFFVISEYLQSGKILKIEDILYQIESLNFEDILKVIKILENFEHYSISIIA